MNRHTLLLVLLSVVYSSYLQAEDLTTTTGTVYKNIKVSAETQDSIRLMHEGGFTVVKKKDLPAAFIAQHELAPPPAITTTSAEDRKKSIIAKFVATTPVFTTKSGTQYKSSEIKDITPSELKLMTDSGPARVKFTDLPAAIREAFGYDPATSASYENMKEAEVKATEAVRLRMSNAASQVDIDSSRVRLLLLENLGKAWRCQASILRDKDRTVVKAREGLATSAGSRSSTGSSVGSGATVYEASKVTETVVVKTVGPIEVFGLPDYRSLPADAQGRRTITTTIYGFGRCRIQVAEKGETLEDAYEIDRSKAIQLVAKNGPNAVYETSGAQMEAEKEPRLGIGSGTGFAITSDGYLGTSAHVVKGATDIKVSVYGAMTAAQVIVMDEVHDVAIIKVNGVKTNPLPIIPTKEVKLGADVFTVGFPLASRIGQTHKFTKGSVSANDAADDLQISVPIQHGNSGGALCDAKGNVVGIIKALLRALPGQDAPQNVNFAAKSDYLIDLAKSIPDIHLESDMPSNGTPEERVKQATFFIEVTKMR